MTSNYYIKIGSDSYSFNAIFIREGAANIDTKFYDNNANLTANYRNIIATNNLQIKHTSVNYINGSIDISQYLLPKFQEFTTTPSTGTSVTVPSWCTTIKAIIIGGGGGSSGDSDDDYYSYYGSGGGGGQYRYYSISWVNCSNLIVIVGNGGSSGNYNNAGYGGGVSSIKYTNSLSIQIELTASYGGGGGVVNGGAGGSDSNFNNYGVYTGYNGSSGANRSTSENSGGLSGLSTLTEGIRNIYHQGLESLLYGKGGNTGDDGNGGYVRLYFCLN